MGKVVGNYRPIRKMHLTFDETIKEHRKMWRTIAEMEHVPGKPIMYYKMDYLRKHAFLGVTSECFCCDFLDNLMNLHFDQLEKCSKYCPVIWSKDFDLTKERIIFCFCDESPYNKLCFSEELSDDDFKQLCLEIANLPVNKEAERL